MSNPPLNPGERWFLAHLLSRFIRARESGDAKRAGRLECKVSWTLGKFYAGRNFAFCGLVFMVDESTPKDCVSIREFDSLD